MLVKLQEIRIDYTDIKFFTPVGENQIRLETSSDKVHVITYPSETDRNNALRNLDAFVGIECC